MIQVEFHYSGSSFITLNCSVLAPYCHFGVELLWSVRQTCGLPSGRLKTVISRYYKHSINITPTSYIVNPTNTLFPSLEHTELYLTYNANQGLKTDAENQRFKMHFIAPICLSKF